MTIISNSCERLTCNMMAYSMRISMSRKRHFSEEQNILCDGGQFSSILHKPIYLAIYFQFLRNVSGLREINIFVYPYKISSAMTISLVWLFLLFQRIVKLLYVMTHSYVLITCQQDIQNFPSFVRIVSLLKRCLHKVLNHEVEFSFEVSAIV